MKPGLESGVRLCPPRAKRDTTPNDPIRLEPSTLAVMTDRQIDDLVGLLAEMLSADVDPKGIPLRRAA